MRRIIVTTTIALATLLVLAPAALAHNNGQGLWGETNDKVTTDAGFIVIIFFPALILLLSLLQARLEKRKHARMAAQKARQTSPQWRGGW